MSGAVGAALGNLGHNLGRAREGINTAREDVTQRVGDGLHSGRVAVSSIQQKGNQSYTQLSEKLSDLAKDAANVDMVAMKDAGFGSVGKLYEKHKKESLQKVFDLGGPVRAKVMFGLLEATKTAATSDPDMFDLVRRGMGGTIDVFWNDLTVFVEQLYEDQRNNALGRVAKTIEELEDIGPKPTMCSPRWFRGVVLYHWRPFDRSIFGQLRDPVWLLLTVISLITFYGIRVGFFGFILLLIVTGCPADEYQLVAYILGFKGTQFISSGVIQAMVAGVKFYLCVYPDGSHSCDTNGPGANQDIISGLIDFLGSCILTWVAFFCLNCSERSAGMREVVAKDEESDAPAEEEPERGCCGRKIDSRTRGGRIRRLLCYDIFCFLLSCAFLAFLLWINAAHLRPGEKVPHRHAGVEDLSKNVTTGFGHVAVFWTRVFYSMLSVPFFFFSIPGLNSILTHTTPTGYNRNGRCVPCILRPMPSEEPKKD